MSHKCEAITKSGERCKKFTLPDTLYCCRHPNGDVVPKSIHKKCPNPIDPGDTCKSLGDCSICLEEVSGNDDCGLLCKHPHHIACILQLKVNPVCPVCRGTIEGSLLNKKDKTKMDNRLKKEKEVDHLAQIEADRRLALRLERSSYNTARRYEELTLADLQDMIAILRGPRESYHRINNR